MDCLPCRLQERTNKLRTGIYGRCGGTTTIASETVMQSDQSCSQIQRIRLALATRDSRVPTSAGLAQKSCHMYVYVCVCFQSRHDPVSPRFVPATCCDDLSVCSFSGVLILCPCPHNNDPALLCTLFYAIMLLLLLLGVAMVVPGYGNLSSESGGNSQGSLVSYMSEVRLTEDMTYEQRNAVQRRLNYTVPVSVYGYECMGYIPSKNLTDNFVVWKISDGATAGFLAKNTFECTESQWVEYRLNCDLGAGRTCADGRPVVPSVEIFQGGGSCPDLTAAMNILHGEDPSNDEYTCGGQDRDFDLTSYENTCSGAWRSCPYNIFFSGKMTPIPAVFDTTRFHLHAHNVQGNGHGWQGCQAGTYTDMAPWPRWQRATYAGSSIESFIDIYEGGDMQKCTQHQDDWFIHVKGYAYGTFCADQRLVTLATHTCQPRYKLGNLNCYSSDQGYCLMDFTTFRGDTSMCSAPNPGPRTFQQLNAWCCGTCA